MGRDASGVQGMRLRAGDEVIAISIAQDDADLLVVTENGYGKRTRIDEYPPRAAAGMGVKTVQLTEAKGQLAGARVVREGYQVMLISTGGTVIKMPVEDIKRLGRSTQGVIVMRLREGEQVSTLAPVVESDDEPELREVVGPGRPNRPDRARIGEISAKPSPSQKRAKVAITLKRGRVSPRSRRRVPYGIRRQVDLLEPINLAEHLGKVELYLGQVCQIAGISKMQLDYWTNKAQIPTKGKKQRIYDIDALETVMLIKQAKDKGLNLGAAIEAARTFRELQPSTAAPTPTRRTGMVARMAALVLAAVAGTATPAVASIPSYGPVQELLVLPRPDAHDWAAIPTTAVGDFNGDGLDDVLVTRAAWPKPRRPSRFCCSSTTGTGDSWTVPRRRGRGRCHGPCSRIRIAVADFNGDRVDDAFLADTGSDTAPYAGYQSTLLLSAPGRKVRDGTAGLPQQFTYAYFADAADVEHDGDRAAYLGNTIKVSPQILLNDGAGRFAVAHGALPAALDPPANVTASRSRTSTATGTPTSSSQGLGRVLGRVLVPAELVRTAERQRGSVFDPPGVTAGEAVRRDGRGGRHEGPAPRRGRRSGPRDQLDEGDAVLPRPLAAAARERRHRAVPRRDRGSAAAGGQPRRAARDARAARCRPERRLRPLLDPASVWPAVGYPAAVLPQRRCRPISRRCPTVSGRTPGTPPRSPTSTATAATTSSSARTRCGSPRDASSARRCRRFTPPSVAGSACRRRPAWASCASARGGTRSSCATRLVERDCGSPVRGSRARPAPPSRAERCGS